MKLILLSFCVMFVLSFSMVSAQSTINIFSETSGLSYNTSNMRFKSFCTNQTETINPTNHTFNIVFNCTPQRIILTITNSTGSSTSRSLVPASIPGTFNFFMINLSNSEKMVSQTWQIYDLSSQYNFGVVRAKTPVPGFGLATISESTIDADNKVFLDLVLGVTYNIEIVDSNLSNARNIGGIETSTSPLINLEVSRVSFKTAARIPARDILITYSQDFTGQIIQILYNDTLGETNSVNTLIINASNITQVFFNSTSISSIVTFTFSGVNTNSSYIITITSNHSRYGVLVDTKTLAFTVEAEMTPQEVVDLGMDVWLGVAAIIVCGFVLLAFARKNPEYGIAMTMLLVAMFMFWGWFRAFPQVGWSFIILLLIFVVVHVMNKKSTYQ